MKLTIHNNLDRVKDLFNKLENKPDRDLTFWDNYTKIIMSNDKCALFFANTGNDFYELHLAFDKDYRGKKSLQIIKQGIKWMLDNKTSRVVCGIPKTSLNIRMLARQVGFKKVGSEQGKEFYEIRREK